jgi:PAS domain S-box-containing protein
VTQQAKTILLVEDESIVALAESYKLRAFGYEVSIANSGEEAIELASGRRKLDLILMDIDLGDGIDGPEAARRILATQNIPIVFLTGHSEKAFVEKVKKVSRYGYVIKNSSDFVLQSSIDMAFEFFEANERIRVERDGLREAKETAERYLNMAAAIIVSADSSGKILLVNDSGCTMLGFGREELIGKDWFETCLPLGARKGLREAFSDIMRGEAPLIQSSENLIMTKNGAARTILWHHALLKGKDGVISGAFSSGEDVTERKLAEEKALSLVREKEILLKEVNHRIRNDMTSLGSLLALQANSTRDPNVSAALYEAQGRVNCMQALYDKLYRYEGRHLIPAKEYFDDLVWNIKSSALYPSSNITLAFHGGDALLSADILFPLGILTNELITNAIKHAFPNGRAGTIIVDFQAPSDKGCVLTVSDDGIGLSKSGKTDDSHGLGLELVNALTEQLHGHLKISRDAGMIFTITFAVEKGQGSEDASGMKPHSAEETDAAAISRKRSRVDRNAATISGSKCPPTPFSIISTDSSWLRAGL